MWHGIAFSMKSWPSSEGAQPMMAQLAEAGKLTLEDVRELKKTIKKVEQQRKAERTRKSK